MNKEYMKYTTELRISGIYIPINIFYHISDNLYSKGPEGLPGFVIDNIVVTEKISDWQDFTKKDEDLILESIESDFDKLDNICITEKCIDILHENYSL